jgi:hypothetical protein
VQSGSAADQAGLKDGDVITEFEGKKVPDANSLIVAIRARSVTRETVRKFADGGEEQRFRLADGTFIRLDFPDPDGDSHPRAIIVSGADAATPADALTALTGAFGPPTWKSRTGETVMWHARGGAEDIVTPDAGAPFVAELHTLPGQPPSYTLAKPSWYQPKGQ